MKVLTKLVHYFVAAILVCIVVILIPWLIIRCGGDWSKEARERRKANRHVSEEVMDRIRDHLKEIDFSEDTELWD